MENIPLPSLEKASEIILTPASPNDAAAIAYIQQEGWLATYPNNEYGITREDILSKNFKGEERVQKRIERLLGEGESAQTWIAKEAEVPVGYSSAIKGEDINKIVSLYILPEYQGKGIGSKLLLQALEWLGTDKNIELGVVPYNQPAIHFYKKFGFRLGEPIVHDQPTFSNGKDMPEVSMNKIGSPE